MLHNYYIEEAYFFVRLMWRLKKDFEETRIYICLAYNNEEPNEGTWREGIDDNEQDKAYRSYMFLRNLIM